MAYSFSSIHLLLALYGPFGLFSDSVKGIVEAQRSVQVGGAVNERQSTMPFR